MKRITMKRSIMKRITKQLFGILLAVLILSGFSGVYTAEGTIVKAADTKAASAEASANNVKSGSFGPYITWNLDTSTGCLTINGNGAMPKFTHISDIPWYGQNIRTLVINEGVTSICAHAFENCFSLKTVRLPASLTFIGTYAFDADVNIYSVDIANVAAWCGVTIESANANPMECAVKVTVNGTLLEKLVIPEGVTSIGSFTFEGCKDICSVSIPDSVTTIGDFAFEGCKKLENFTLPVSVNKIGAFAFADCQKLTDISIPFGVEELPESVFMGCTQLQRVTLPASLKEIGNFAFAFTGLTEAIIPESVSSIGYHAFDTFSSLNKMSAIYILNPNCKISGLLVCKAVVVYGFEGSTAQEYAKKENLTFRTINSQNKNSNALAVSYENASFGNGTGTLETSFRRQNSIASKTGCIRNSVTDAILLADLNVELARIGVNSLYTFR